MFSILEILLRRNKVQTGIFDNLQILVAEAGKIRVTGSNNYWKLTEDLIIPLQD